MTRRLLPVFLSAMLLGPLLTAGASAQDLPANGDRSRAESASPAQTNDGRVAVTRSDGSTGRTKPPDPSVIRKLVSYMREGINRADRSEKQRQTRRVQNKRR